MSSRLQEYARDVSLSLLSNGDESLPEFFGPGARDDALLHESYGPLRWRVCPFQNARDEIDWKAGQEVEAGKGALAVATQHRHHRQSHPPALSPAASSSIPCPAAAAFYDPFRWFAAYSRLRAEAFPPGSHTTLAHRKRATLSTKGAVRAACCVCVLPQLDAIKAALKRSAADHRREWHEMWDSASMLAPESRGGTGARQRGSPYDEASMPCLPTPNIWAALSKPQGHEIGVFDAFSGAPLMRIAEPKGQVAVTSLLHAPFRGFMNRQLKVLPVHAPKDLLRLKSQQMIETDYVWVGFADGSVRLFPANPNRIRSTDRSEQISKGQLEDVIFELPKYHNASIIAIVRSPCHRDDEGMDLSTMNRLSAVIQYMTAASSKISEGNREHLSLMCTASVDSSIVIWDVRKIYQALESMRVQKQKTASQDHGPRRGGPWDWRDAHPSPMGSCSYLDSISGDVVTIEGCASDSCGSKKAFCMRFTCTMIKVRPVLRLKGGVAGLKNIQWVSTLVTTEGHRTHRHVAGATRNAEEKSAPAFVKRRHEIQTLTRFQRREEYRRVLQLDEKEMQEVEKELKNAMPPLNDEPVQSLRVNLIIAGDSVGTIHLWNIDEELDHSQMQDSSDCGVESVVLRPSLKRVGSLQHTTLNGVTPHTRVASVSSRCTSLGSHQMRYSVASPSVQMSALGSTSKTSHRVGGKIRVSKAVPTKGTSTVTIPLLGEPSRGTTASALKKRGVTATKGKEAKGPVLAKPRELFAPVTTSMKPSKRIMPAIAAYHPKLPHSAKEEGHHGSAGAKLSAPAAATETLLGRLSRLQKLAAVQQNAHTSLKEINAVMYSENLNPINNGSSAPKEGPIQQSKRRTGVVPRMQTPLKSIEITCRKASLSQAKATKGEKSKTPVRQTQRSGGGFLGSRGASSSNKGTRVKSPRRTRSPHDKDLTSSGIASRNDNLCRASKCRIEFTGGVAITGMAVDAPGTLRTTLRRWPSSEARPFSLLEEHSQEEMERRALENSFETLTEDKALFFMLEQLQLYVAIEGVVVSLGCAPSWREGADQQAHLERRRACDAQGAAVFARSPAQVEEMPTVGRAEFPSFTVQFQQRVLEAHSQPVTQLFFDRARGLIWVARRDGLLSLFSKGTNQVVTRVAHPCADAALAPPSSVEWERQQHAYICESSVGQLPLHLEQHEETLGYQPAHFSGFLPFCKRTQTTLILLSGQRRVHAEPSASGMPYSLWYESEDYTGSLGPAKQWDSHNYGEHSSSGFALMQAQKLDGRSDMDVHARWREICSYCLISQLLYCRFNADKVRRAQKDGYQAQCNTVSRRVRYIMQELRICASSSTLSRYYDIWKKQARYRRLKHVMRRQRESRALQLTPALNARSRVAMLALQGRYFFHWVSWHSKRVRNRKTRSMQKLLSHLILRTRRLPSVSMMQWLWERHTQACIFQLWKSFSKAGRQRPQRAHSISTDPGNITSTPATVSALHKSDPRSYCSLVNDSPLVRTSTSAYQTFNLSLSVQHTTNCAKGCTPNGNYSFNEDGVTASNEQGRRMSLTAYNSQLDAHIDPLHSLEHEIVTDKRPNESHPENSSFVLTFLEMMVLLFDVRHVLMQFKENHTSSQSVLDESWLSVVENGEGSANVNDEGGRRLAVFSYGLLPLLQGLLSTAAYVLPDLSNPQVAEDLASMMCGIQLCMDYVTADSEEYLASLLAQKNTAQDASSTALSTTDDSGLAASATYDRICAGCDAENAAHPSRKQQKWVMEAPPNDINTTESKQRALQHNTMPEMSSSSTFMQLMRFFVLRAMRDQESLDALIEISREKESLEAFLAFLEDENSVERRCPIFA